MLTRRLSELNNRGRLVTVVPLALILLVALYRWALAPHVAYVGAVQRCAPAVARIGAARAAVAEALADDEQDLQALREHRAELQGVLFDAGEAEAFSNGLETLVAGTGCSILSVHRAIRAVSADRDEDVPTPGTQDEDVPTPGTQDEDVPTPGIEDEDVPTPGIEDEDVLTPGIQAVDYRLGVQGSFRELTVMLRALQTQRAGVFVRGLRLEGSAEQAGVLRGQVDVGIYVIEERGDTSP